MKSQPVSTVEESCRAVREHYTALQRFYERLTRDLCIHFPLWLPRTRTIAAAVWNGPSYMSGISKPQKGQYVLDAGCGLGGTAFWMAERFQVRVLGVSNSSENIERCCRLASDRDPKGLTEFQTADLMGQFAPPCTFDSVWNLESLNYLCPKRRYIHTAFEILKPGGTWVCMDRYCDLKSAVGDQQRAADALTTGLYTSKHWEGVETLQRYMAEAGFQEIKYVDLTSFVINRPLHARLTGLARGSAAALVSLRDHTFLDAFVRTLRVVGASFNLMRAGQMTYGLISGVKPLSGPAIFTPDSIRDQPGSQLA